MLNWKSIDTAPWGETVLLCGDSGMCKPNNKTISLGYRRKDYHGGEWNDIQGDYYSDMFPLPTHWTEIPNLP